MTKERKGLNIGGIVFGLRQSGKTPESSVLNRLEPEQRKTALAAMREAKDEVLVETTDGTTKVVLERATF